MGRAAADNRSRGKSSSNTQRGNAARRKSHSGGTKVIQALDCQSKPFSWGSKGAILFCEREWPLCPRRPQAAYPLALVRRKGAFSHVRECSLSTHKCEGVCRLRAAGAKGPFSFAKENGPFGTPRERLRLAVQSLNDLCASGMRLPARGVAALGVARRFASAPIIRCRSAHLVEVQPNFRLPKHSTMRRAQQCRYFARSLPPSKRHSRLTIVRRG